MRIHFIRAFFWVAILSSFQIVARVEAATISMGGSEVMGCRIALEGVIEDGDADKLRAVLDGIGYTADYTPVGRRICLNSPGGLLAEAVEMADIVGEWAYGTAVAQGATCNSACAVLFLAGRYRHPEAGGAHSVDRILHPKGQLGFHAPSLLLGERSYSRQEVDTAYAIALNSMAAVLRHRANMGTALPDSLFLTLLETPPSQMTYIETVAQAAQWQIDVAPVEMPPNGAREALTHVCSNADAGLVDYTPQFEGRLLDFTFEELTDDSLYALSSRDFRYEGSARCELRMYAGNGPVSSMGAAFYTGGATDQDVSRSIYPYMLYAPERKISTLPVALAGNTTHEDNFFRAVQSPDEAGGALGGFNSCRLVNTRAKVINVNEFVNLRAAPGLRAPVVGQLRLAEEVQVPDPGRLLPLRDNGRASTCLSICNALANNPSAASLRDEARGCIDENMLWYQIVDRTGNTGFVSRKFLAD